MLGQSNMAGRGYTRDVALIGDEKIKMLRNGRWQMMFEPVNYDHPAAGTSLAASFAACWRLDHAAAEIGLIPCAEGGSSLDDWAVGGVLFEHALMQARLAGRSSRLAGILWHQGESDCFADKVPQYGEKLGVIISALREALAVPGIPLIIGGLGGFLTKGIYGQYFTAYPLINKALEEFANNHAHCYFVTAEGLTANPDQIHFNAHSQRIFGIRYYQAYQKLKSIFVPPENENQLLAALHAQPHSKAVQIKLLELSFSTAKITKQQFLEQLAGLNE